MGPFPIVKKRHFLSSKMALAKKPFEIDPYIVYFSESSYQGLALDIGFGHIHWVFSFHENSYLERYGLTFQNWVAKVAVATEGLWGLRQRGEGI